MPWRWPWTAAQPEPVSPAVEAALTPQPLEWDLSAPDWMLAEAMPMSPALTTTRRKGYEYGQQPDMVTSVVSRQRMRVEEMGAYAQLYVQCPVVSACVDVIARSITAGGLETVPDADASKASRDDRSPSLQRYDALVRWCNPREDLVQVLRSSLTDLLIFGDAYIEVVRGMGSEPVAVYSLDSASMVIDADEHGDIRQYVQLMEDGRKAEFAPDEIIHVSMDAPRGGLYGASPVEKIQVPAVTWLWAEACLKEIARRGDPARLHFDWPAGAQEKNVQRWGMRYQVRNLGSKNIGTPILTSGGVKATEFSHNKIAELLDLKRQARDDILSGMGVPPHEVGIIESGNLGGGTGETQRKTFRYDVCGPIAKLLLEKWDFSILQQGFGITDHHSQFREIDYRDSETVEKIRDTRWRGGAITTNRWREEIGEPPVPGGDDAIVVLRNAAVFVSDLADYSAATIEGLAKGAQVPEPLATDASSGEDNADEPDDEGDETPDTVDATDDGKPARKRKSRESDTVQAALEESWARAYKHRRKKALAKLPPP